MVAARKHEALDEQRRERPTVRAVTIRVWQHDVPGARRRRWLTRPQAYRSAALAMVNAKCQCDSYMVDVHEVVEACGYCSRKCEGHKSVRHTPSVYHPGWEECGDCSNDPTHSYRYRLVARLARWLGWRDRRLGGGTNG